MFKVYWKMCRGYIQTVMKFMEQTLAWVDFVMCTHVTKYHILYDILFYFILFYILLEIPRDNFREVPQLLVGLCPIMN